MTRNAIAVSTASMLAAATPVAAQTVERVAPENMRRVAPALAEYTDRVLFGDVWKRPGLALRDRSLVTISALIATGKTPQLTGHLGRGLDNGITPEEVSGIVTHLAFYSGWPNAVSAVSVIEDVFHRRGIAPPPPSAPTPIPTSGTESSRVLDSDIAQVAPKLADLTGEVIDGGLWLRPDLTPRDRSLVTIAAMIAAGDVGELAFHLRRGIANGLTRDQISETVTHLAFYAGWPKARAAAAILSGVMAP